jgi:hypothetical protein
MGKYRLHTPCADIYDMYTDNQLENLASDEFYWEYVKDGIKNGRKIEPTLHCFCLKQSELDETRLDTIGSEREKLKIPKVRIERKVDDEELKDKVTHDEMQFLTS